MITDYEFLITRQFDRTLVKAVDGAQEIINRKNALLVAADRQCAAQNQRIAALEAALLAERKKTAQLAGQLQRFMAMH